jgi:hypothetical protein
MKLRSVLLILVKVFFVTPDVNRGYENLFMPHLSTQQAVSCLLSFVSNPLTLSCLLSPAFCLLSSVSCLLYSVFCLQLPFLLIEGFILTQLHDPKYKAL